MQPASKKTGRWHAAKRTLATAFLAVAGTMGCEGRERPRPPDMAYSTFVQELEKERIQRVIIDGQMIIAAKQNFHPSGLPPNTDGPPLVTYMPANEDLNYLRKSKAQIDVIPPDPPARIPWMTLGVTFLAFSVGSIFLQYHLQKKLMTGAGGKAGNMGKARAREIPGEGQRVRFSDVAGIDEVKADLQEIVGFLRNPRQFQQLGAKVPRGILLSGPPGTGKTLIARALAGEAGVPFFETSGSEFVEMFVGVGAARVRSLFDQAKKKAPSIIFIDEIDAVGRQRGAGIGNDEREQTLNQVLTEMQGFDGNSGVIVVAATNRPDVLDSALMRPGRFDRKISVGRPDLNGRERILEVHTRNKPLAEDVDLRRIARGIPGFAGADIENLVNEAALLAGRYKSDRIGAMHFSQARDKILMGTERKLLISNAELDNTAHHEAGHAVVSLFTPGNDPIEKASIIPRDRTLGVVVTLPEKDEYSVTVRKMKSKLAVLAAGRIAEELFTGDKDLVTGGAQNDISVMTDIATQMVRTLGMSDLGMRSYGEDRFGRALFSSASKQEKIDAAIDGLVKEAMDTARKVLTEHEKEWRGLAKALRQHETIDGDDIRALVLEGKEISPVRYPPPPPPTPSAPENPAPALKREWKPWK